MKTSSLLDGLAMNLLSSISRIWRISRMILLPLLCLLCLFVASFLLAADRSSKWDAFRDRLVAAQPYCSLCASTNDLEVHHIQLFAQHPELELVDSNCIVLCRHCHWQAGHLGISWDVANNEILELLNGVGDLLHEKRLAVRSERRSASLTNSASPVTVSTNSNHLILHTNLESYVRMHQEAAP